MLKYVVHLHHPAEVEHQITQQFVVLQWFEDVPLKNRYIDQTTSPIILGVHHA
jgi:hypothetical protein